MGDFVAWSAWRPAVLTNTLWARKMIHPNRGVTIHLLLSMVRMILTLSLGAVHQLKALLLIAFHLDLASVMV